MSENDEINQKLDELKKEADSRKKDGVVLSGDHEVRVVANASNATVTPSFLDKASVRIKAKAKDTFQSVFIPWMEDLMYNTADDFLYRMIYRGSDGNPPVRNGGGSRRRSGGYTDYGWRSSNRVVGGSMARNSAYSSQDDPYSQADAEIYRSIILPNLGAVQDVFNEVNRLMMKYPAATIADAYTAAHQANKIQPEDLNYGWSRDRYPNGLQAAWERVSGRDANNKPITLFRCKFPEPDEVDG